MLIDDLHGNTHFFAKSEKVFQGCKFFLKQELSLYKVVTTAVISSNQLFQLTPNLRQPNAQRSNNN